MPRARCSRAHRSPPSRRCLRAGCGRVPWTAWHCGSIEPLKHMAEPLPLCYLNGAYLPLTEARISPLDRGFLYADAVYELMPVYGGRAFRFPAHGERLTRSLAGISMADPHTREEWRAILGTLIERNGGGDCYVYWQVTGADILERGVACVTAADSRWARCDIKSTALLANVLLRQLSVDAAAAETILLRDGELKIGRA